MNVTVSRALQVFIKQLHSLDIVPCLSALSYITGDPASNTIHALDEVIVNGDVVCDSGVSCFEW